jgi:hypothetical protein
LPERTGRRAEDRRREETSDDLHSPSQRSSVGRAVPRPQIQGTTSDVPGQPACFQHLGNTMGWRTAWRQALKTAGFRCRFHDLRHTCITRLAESQASDMTGMAIAGHVSKKMLEPTATSAWRETNSTRFHRARTGADGFWGCCAPECAPTSKEWVGLFSQAVELIGGRDRDRTCDLMLAKHALSQLSYTPTVGLILNYFTSLSYIDQLDPSGPSASDGTSLRPLLKLSREMLVRLRKTEGGCDHRNEILF